MKTNLLRVIALLLTVIFSVSSMSVIIPTLVSANSLGASSAKNTEKTPVLPFTPFSANGIGGATTQINEDKTLFTETDTVTIFSDTKLDGIIAEAPPKDESVSSVLKVTPMMSGSAVTYNYATVSHTFEKTTDLTEEKGLKINTVSGNEYTAKDTTVSQAYSNIAFEKRNSFVGADGVMFYLKLDAANVVAPNFAAFIPETVGRWTYDFDPVLMLMVGKEYSYKSINDNSWTTATAVQDKSEGAYFGAMKFDTAFEGYVKIPFESLGNDLGFKFKPNQDSFKLMCIRTVGLGGKYGTVTAGPYFVVNKDSTSTNIEVNNASFSAAPANIGTKINGFKEPLKNADALLVYAKTDAANRITVSANMWDDYLSDIPSLVLKSNATVYVASLGSENWTEIKTVETEADGAVQFDTAFEGYIKIPITSLKEQEASPFIAIYPEIDYITGVEICAAGIGGEFGSVEVAPFLINEDKGTTIFVISDEYKPPVASATEVEPVLNTEIQKGNWQTVTHTEVKPLDYTNATATQMTAKAAEGYEQSNLNSSQAYANFKLNDVALSGYEGLVFYIKTDSANIATPQIALNIPSDTTRWKYTWDPILSLKVGGQYEYLAINDTEWQTGIAISGVAGSAFYGAVKFESSFEGYVKIPFSSLENDSGFIMSTTLDSVKNIVYRVKGLGGVYGQVTLGPTMFVTKNGTQGIKLKEADPIIVNPVNEWESNQTAIKSTQSVVTPLDWTTAKGLKLEASAKYTNDYPANSLAYARFKINNDFVLGDATHIIWYVKTDSANTVLPRIAYSSSAFNISYDPEMTLGVGKSYSYLPVGSDKWISATSVPTWNNGGNVSNTYFGGMQFDSAFEGYIKIAIADLSNDNARINNADRATTPISNFIVSVAKIGEEYGTVTAGPIFLTNKDSDSPKIELYEAPNENAGVAINAVPITATVEANGINYEKVSAFRGLTLEGYKLSAENTSSTDVFRLNTNTVLNGSNRFLIYAKTDKDTVIVPNFVLNNPNDTSRWSGAELPKLSIGALNEYKLLSFDDVKWVKSSAVKTDDSNTYNAGISLKAGFEGYISLPYTSLVNENGFVLNTELDSINSIEFRFNNLGDNTVTIAPISLITNNGEGVEVIYPTDYDSSDPYERIQGIFERSKLGLAQGNYYMIGDSTRHLYGYPIFRIVRNALKENFNINCTVQALSGLKAEHWSGYTPGLDGPLFPTVEQLIEQIPGTGRNCIVDLALAINDSAKTGDKIYEFLIMGINKIRQAKPEAVIVYTSPSLISFAKQNKNIYDAAELVWADKSIYKIDVMKNVFDDYYSQYYVDTHHPNALGYKLIGQYIVTRYIEGMSFDKIYDIDYNAYTLPKDAEPIQSTLSVNTCHNLTAGVYSMNVNGVDVNSIKLNGSKVCTGEYPFNTQNYIQTEFADDLKGNDYIAFYLKLPAANKIGVRAFTTEDNKEIIFMRGMKYYVMPLGSEEWTEKISTDGRKDEIETYGSLDFDGSFEGWVKLPLYSFYGAPTADDAINGVTFRFSELGGTYGEVRIGSFFAISDEKAETEKETAYTLPKDAKLITSNLSVYKAHNLSGKLYEMQVNGEKVDAIRINGSKICTGEYPFNTQNYIQTELSTDFKGNDYIAFYLKLPAANKMGVRAFTTADDKEIIFMRGMKYYVMPLGSDKWTEKISTDGRKDKVETYGSLDFDGAFEGWVKLPLYSFYGAPTAGDAINGVTFRFSELGGTYGEVRLGSFFSISDPKAADKTFTLPKDAKLITSKLSIYKAHNISGRLYEMQVNGEKVDAIRINGSKVCTGEYPFNTQNYIQTELSTDLKDNDYIAFYLKLPAANKIGVRAFTTADDKEIIFMRGMKYYVMPLGSEEWTEKISTDGRKDLVETYGALDFDGAFEGWIKLPLYSFYGAPTADDAINGVTFRFSELGGTYGEVRVGSFFAISDAKAADKTYTLPKDATPITSKLNVYKAYNISARIYGMQVNGVTVDAMRINGSKVCTGEYPFNTQNYIQTELSEALNGNDYIAFYLKLPAANKIGVRAFKAEENKEIIFRRDMKYYVMPLGSEEWNEKISTDGRKDLVDTYGALDFDGAFEGWVKLPLNAFYGSPSAYEDINGVTFRFSELGGTYGEVCLGAFFAISDKPYTAENVWKMSDLPEMVPFTPIKSLDSPAWVYRDYIDSPIPSLSTNKALVIGSDPAADYASPNYAHSIHWVSTEYEEMSLGKFTHLVFYIKAPKSKENRFTLHIETSKETFQIMANMSYQLLPMGETKWQHYASERTINSIGGVIIPAGFEGLVKIPAASLLPANRLTDDTILKKIFYRFSYIGMGDDRVIVGPAFGVTKDNDTGPDEIVYTSLPEATTIKSLYAIEDKDKFTDSIMLYWEAFEGAKYYIAEAYSITKTENGFEYRLVASNRCVSNSGAITDLMPGRKYAVLIKAYDLRDKLLAIYDYTTVETPETDWCEYPNVSDEMKYDKVYYAKNTKGNNGALKSPIFAVVIGGASVALLGIVAVVFAVVYKRRKKNA